MSGRVATLRFDVKEHEYTDMRTGQVVPSITQMLDRTGWIDDTWYTEESCERGAQIHRLTADYDLGGLDVGSLVSKYRGYVLAHAAAMKVLRPDWTHVEIPLIASAEGFGGRPDRIGKALSLKTVLEIKSGVPTKAHPIQLALQAILAAADGGLPAEHYARLLLYVKHTGKYILETCRQRRDFDEAHRIIKVCCK